MSRGAAGGRGGRPWGRIEARSPQAADLAALLRELGDLALLWSAELLHAGLPTTDQLTRILPLMEQMRTDVILGQYLDLAADVHQHSDVEAALTTIRYKTAKYAIERPLSLGAALAGADQNLLDVLTAFAIPLGEAIQLRDDLLSVFGDSATRKPALDDLRKTKPTVLIALALQRVGRAQAEQLRLFLGCPTPTDDQADVARRIIAAVGADQTVEHMITERYEKALTHLARAPLEPTAAHALRTLADSTVRRST
ncbi:polyprenyl synthetase family protein [Streptomyces sp. NPDC055287]